MMLYTIRYQIKSSFRIYNQSLVYIYIYMPEKTKLDDLLVVEEFIFTFLQVCLTNKF